MDHHLGSVTSPQLDALWEFLKVNEDVAAGDTFEDMLRHCSSWETAAVVLNAIEDDCFKDWRSWAQLWIDIKFQIRQKLYHQMPRAGQDNPVMFSDIETRFSQFVGNIETPLEHIRQKIVESRMANDVESIKNESKMNQKQGSDDESETSEYSSDDDKPLSNNVRRCRVIQPQLNALFEALSSNTWVTAGFNKSAESRRHYRKFWEKAANTLNAIPEGDNRNWRSWAKYWVDYKAKANKKIRSYKNGDTSIELSSNDLLFMQIMKDAPKLYPTGCIKISEWEATTNDQNRVITSEVDKDNEDSMKGSDEESVATGTGDDSNLDTTDALDIDALSRQRQRRVVNTEQLAALYQCLQHNRKVAMGHTKSTKSRYEARIVWKKAAKVLNAVPDGDVKDWKGWSKYWIDLKAKTKKRVSQVRAGHYRQPLTSLEIKFMQLINVDVSDLTASCMDTSETVVSNDYEIPNPEDNSSFNNLKQHSVDGSDTSGDDIKRCRRVSLQQLNALWECLNADREVAFGCNNTSELRLKALKMWKKTAETLNAIKDGDTKTWKAWSKYWVDLKGKINHRVRRINGGEKHVLLTPSDLRFLELIRMADSDKAGNNGDRKNGNSLKRHQRSSSDEEPDKHSATCSDNDKDSDVDDKVQGCRRVSLAQQNALWECLNANKQVAFGFNKTAESRHLMREMWTKTARILNAIKDGDVKSWKAWSKYWVDVKAKLNSRLRRMKAGATDVQLTNTDLKFLQLIQTNLKADKSESSIDYDSSFSSLATSRMNNQKYPKKKKTPNKQKFKKHVKESLNSETSSNLHTPSPNLEENTEISNLKRFKQEHIELEVANLNQAGILDHKTQKSICTECNLDQDSVIRNHTYSNLLMNELQYLLACMRSQAYINMLRYLDNLKTKHNNINNLTQKDSGNDYFTSELDNLHTDPLRADHPKITRHQ